MQIPKVKSRQNLYLSSDEIRKLVVQRNVITMTHLGLQHSFQHQHFNIKTRTITLIISVYQLQYDSFNLKAILEKPHTVAKKSLLLEEIIHNVTITGN